jgi:putative holliday junction resolvase
MRDETVLAFDFGVKRIGVAVGERRLGQARALTTIADEANAQRFAAIGKLIDEWKAARLLVGRPLSDDGSPHEMTDRCERFANQLAGRFQLAVDLVDERFSSLTADEEMRQSGSRKTSTWQQRKERIDAEAARVILQSWFDTATVTTPEAHETR